MKRERRVSLFRNGRNQAVRIPREFEMPGSKAIMRKIGNRLILEPEEKTPLLDVLAMLSPLAAEDQFPEIDDNLPSLDDSPLESNP